MKKKRMILVVLSLLVGLFAFFGFDRFRAASPERALPRFAEDSPYLLIKAEEPFRMRERLGVVLGAFQDVEWGGARQPLFELLQEMEDVLDLTEVSGPMAFLFTPKESSRFHLAFYSENSGKVGEKSFADFIADLDKGLYEVKAWKSEASGEGWIVLRRFPFSFGAGKDALVYIVRRMESGRELIFAAENEAGVETMLSAWRSRASRMKIKRYNKAPGYVQVGFPLEAIKPDATGIVAFEAALQTDERSAYIQLYSNVLSLLGGGVTPKSGVNGKDLPLLGRGELSFVFSLDIPFASFALYPNATDPVGRLLESLNLSFPFEFKQNLEQAMYKGRISAVVVAPYREGSLGAAYLALESKNGDALRSLLEFLTKSFEPAKLDGWEKVYISRPNFSPPLLVAQRGDLLLFGLGAIGEYGEKAIIPDAIKSFAAPGELCNLVMTSALFKKSAEVVRNSFRKAIHSGRFNWPVPDRVELSGDYALQLRVITAERANLSLYRNDEGK